MTDTSLFVHPKPETSFLMDEYAAVTPGEPFRLMKFGTVVKGGIKHVLTPAYAATMKLPHWKPAIKLGSHEETTPAGGQITGLEVRQDGLYAIPEFTAKGLKAVADGDYRYQSPEILWDNSALENPGTGELMPGPFIVGVALLHNPHLGENAALYSYEPQQGVDNMAQEKFEIPKSLWDQFSALFGPKKPETQAAVIVDPEQFAAAVKERDELKAQVAQVTADNARKAAVDNMAAEIRGEKYGQLFKDEKFSAEAAEHFIAMPEAERAWALQKFAALSSQVKLSKILTEFGQTGEQNAGDPKQEFAAVISSTMKEQKVSYATAFNLARTANPELAAAYAAAVSKKTIAQESE